MAPRYLCVLLVSLAACSSGSSGDPRPGEAATLAGTWDLVVHRAGQDDLLATVTLTPSDPKDASIPVALRGGTLDGHFRLGNRAWLLSAPTDSGTSAFIGADSAVILYLRLQGRCVNCGNLGFAGHLTGNQVTGHWTQEYSTDAPDGTFDLRRHE